MPDRGLPLDPAPEDVRRLADAAARRAAEFLRTLPEQPASDLAGAEEAAALFGGALPEEGRDGEELLDLVFSRAVPKGFNTASPGWLAFVGGSGLVAAGVADLVHAATNRYVTARPAAPAFAQMEATVVRWFADIVGYPATAGGALTSGGSGATLAALVAARRDRLPEDFLSGTLYASSEAHHSVAKAAAIAGFPERNVRIVPVDARFRMRADALRDMVRADRAEGRKPFFVVANAGTTNTGAVDDLNAVAAVAREENLWMHADAAYGGFFALTERGRRALDGLALSDTVTLDPHKTLFFPFGTGGLVARDVETLRRAHALEGEYMAHALRGAAMSPHEVSIELSRSARGLRVWFALSLHGARPVREALDRCLDLAAWAAEALPRVPHVRVVAPPQLSTLAFRVEPPGVEGEALDALNERVIDGVNARGRVFLSGTRLAGRSAIRVCVLSHRTTRANLEACLEDVAAAVADATRA